MLAANLALHAHQLEAGRLVESDGGLVVPGDPGDHRVEAVGGRQDEELGEQCLADPFSPLGAVDVDGVLGRGRIARALPASTSTL